MVSLVYLFVILLPVAGGLCVYFLRGKLEKYQNPAVMAVTLITSAAVWALMFLSPEKVLLLDLGRGISVSFALDGPGKIFCGLISLLWPGAVCYSFGYMSHEARRNMFYCFYLASYGITLGISLSANMMTMYLFYEMITLVTFPLVLHPMTKEARRAARKYLYFSLSGSAMAFIGLIFIMLCGGGTDFVYGGILSGQTVFSKDLLLAVYFLTFCGFGVKSAVFPLHSWLPSASVAPTPVTALLHAVAVVKSGVFALIRLTYYSYGPDFLRGTWVQYAAILMALFTILYGSAMALKRSHLKRRLAYSTASNLSYIIFALLLLSPAGLAAAFLHFLFHAVTKITAFFCAGNVLHCTGREYVFETDGLGKKMPVTFFCFTVSGLSLAGIPVFCGFFSKWSICRAAFADGGGLAVAGVAVLLVSALLTTVYMFSVSVRAFFMPFRDSEKPAAEAPACMTVPVAVYSLAMIFLGVFSGPLVSLISSVLFG